MMFRVYPYSNGFILYTDIIYGARKDIPRMYEILFLHPLARRKEELEM